ncbi:tol-pal system protein YbgF [Geoalkalibacter sp.]|uniref:tol-pal system protein YbgF n=1 Tax=Geoalkalibacter sp. TaxID=3041440 RepID=UPI00272E054F|nr:tol-pal system protein YbgF [Geoalkalibacter sp.]
MRNKSRILLLLLLLGLLAGGCIPSQSQLRMEQDMQELKRRLAEMERQTIGRTQEQGQELGGRLDALARQQAENQAALDTLRVDLQAVNGRLEDSSRGQTQLRDEMRLLRDDLGLKVSALEDRVARLEGGTGGAVIAPAAAAPAAGQGSPEALYQRGLDQIMRQNDFAGGRQSLEEFLKSHPNHELSINAMYWVGEAFYGERKYENAILQFQDVIQKHGEHPKAASAMLKQGMAFEALGDRRNARVIMEKIIEAYPLSDEAKKARGYLDQWR